MKSLAGGGRRTKKVLLRKKAPLHNLKKKENAKPRNNTEEQQASKELKNIERQIELAEQEIQALENKMADPAIYENTDDLSMVNADYEAKKEELEELMGKWETIMSKSS